MPKYKRGTGSIYRRGKRWWLAYYIDGQQVCESSATTDRGEARRLLQRRLGEIADGRLLVGADKVTLDELAEGFLRDYLINGRRSLRNADLRVRLHLGPVLSGKGSHVTPARPWHPECGFADEHGNKLAIFAHRRAHDLTPSDVQAYVSVRQREGGSNGSINRELACLKRMFTLGMRSGKIARRPYIPMLVEDNVRQGFFDQAEFERLLPHLPDWLRPPVTFAYLTGWRLPSEILTLTWANVDLEAGTVRLDPGTTKTKEGRVIYLTDEMAGVLRTQWHEHETHHPACRYVFQRDGRKIHYPWVSWWKACEAAGLQGRMMHDFRRTAIRNFIRAGVPERVAMQLSGHKTRSVFDRYAIVSDGDLRDAAERLNRALRGRTTTISTTVASSDVDEAHVSH
jgi:integrase